MHLALLGYPLAHSLSPAMHSAALTQVGLSDWRYEAMPVPPERLGEAIAALRGDEYAGANVTVPHKESVIPYLDGLTPVAQAIGAVNTIIKRPQSGDSPSPERALQPGLSLPEKRAQERGTGGEVLLGHNTDAAGLLADLYAHRVSISNSPILILGAGGAARAAVAACAGAGARVRVVARRREQALRLRSLAPQLDLFEWSELGFIQASDDVALILNSTPIGMSPNENESPWPAAVPLPPDAFVYDMIYNPAETQLVRQAREHGLRAATGLGMLVEQGALAFELWAGRPAPRAVMRAVAEGKLREV
jgi:shikimate dehydrogenase